MAQRKWVQWAFLALLGAAACLSPLTIVSAEDDQLVIRLVDPQNRPVAGAQIGFAASFGDMTYENPVWQYLSDPASLEQSPPQILSDERGSARIAGGRQLLKTHNVVARHGERKLMAIETIDATDRSEMTLKLQPECRVTGRVNCRELVQSGKNLERNGINLKYGGRLTIEHYSIGPEFEIFLPPGQYLLSAQGADQGTLTVSREIRIPQGVAELELDPIELTLLRSRQLIGQAAPELSDAIAWKSDGATSLRELKGKVVLLDFWGYWRQACIKELPKLVELHDRHNQDGLAIVGVHIDFGGQIESIEAYETFARSLQNGVLKGREIPFPVALAADKPIPQAGPAEKDATCQIAADYGVQSYPTMILIDRQGRVAGEFHHTAEDIKWLKKLLAETADGDQ